MPNLDRGVMRVVLRALFGTDEHAEQEKAEVMRILAEAEDKIEKLGAAISERA